MIYIREIILVGFFSGLLLLIKRFLSELPKNLHEINMESIKNKNAKELQIDSFYRQTSNQELMDTLKSWIEIIMELNKFSQQEQEHFLEMLSNVVLHGSDKSLTLMADFQQYVYKINSEEDKIDETIENETGKNGVVMMYLASFVVTQLKEDFTGYKINPEDLIRLKMTDYASKKDFINECKEEALNQLTVEIDFIE